MQNEVRKRKKQTYEEKKGKEQKNKERVTKKK